MWGVLVGGKQRCFGKGGVGAFFFGGPKGGTNYLGVTGKIKTATISNV